MNQILHELLQSLKIIMIHGLEIFVIGGSMVLVVMSVTLATIEDGFTLEELTKLIPHNVKK